MAIITLFTYLLIPFILLYKADWNRENKEFLNSNQTLQMKGIFALFVILVHFSQRMGNPGPMILFKNPGYLAVGGFFFISGYGLYSSYLKSNKDLFKKTIIRIGNIYKPFIVITVVYVLIRTFYLENKYSLSDILLYILNIKQIDPITWYLFTMVCFYIMFYISYKYFKEKKSEIVLFILSILYMIVAAYLSKEKIWWYNTTFLFLTGVIFKKYEEKIKKIFINREFILFGISTFLLALHIVLLKENVISQNIITLIFIFSFMLLNNKIKYNSKFFIYLGMISYEIYLVHMKIYHTIFSEKVFGGRTGNLDFVLFFIIAILISIALNYIADIKISSVKKIFIKEK